MSQKYRKFITLLIFILCQPVIQAQMVGCPAGSQGKGEWSLSFSGSFMTQGVGKEVANSQRWLIKSEYGIVSWLNLVATLGAADLTLDSPNSDIDDYKGKPELAFGGGLTLTPKRETENQPLGLFLGLHFLEHHSEGNSYQTIPIVNARRKNHLEYTWRELRLFGGLSYRLSRLRFYLCGIGWSLNRPEKWIQSEYDENMDDWIFIDEKKSEYQSELWTGALAGIEFVFPDTKHTISFEGLFYNTQNYILMVGIGQTGILNSGW